MVEADVIPEDSSIELLGGLLVYVDRADSDGKSVAEGVRHNHTMSNFEELAPTLNGAGHHFRMQCVLLCVDGYLPIPDAVLLRGARREKAGIPTAADALCVVEVADSSYERDTGEKLAGYARAGVPQYVVINLRNKTAEVYETPDVEAGTYARRTVVDAAGSLKLNGSEGGTIDVPLATLLT